MSSKKAVTKVTKKAVKKSVKQTVKKAVAKKAAPKKSTSKKTPTSAAKKKSKTEKKLVAAKGQQCFWVNEGPILKDLIELQTALETMSDAIFAHHVTRERNDFAEWVEYVLKDAETAAALRKSKKPVTAHKVIVRQLKLYKLPK